MTTCTMVDGAQVSVDSDVGDLTLPWTSTFEVRFAGGPAGVGDLVDELEVCPAGNHVFVAERELGGAVTETVSYKGGTLSVASGVTQGLMAWVGVNFEIAGYTRSPAPTLKQALARFDLLEIQEVETGVLVTSRDRGHAVVPYSAAKFVPGVGMINVKSPRESVKLMPAWQGRQIPVGEMWRIDGADSVDDQILIGTASCAAVLSPTNGRSLEDMVQFSEKLSSLRWTK